MLKRHNIIKWKEKNIKKPKDALVWKNQKNV